MDSLTQIVLGAAVGEAVLGKKIGNKAMLWGAIAGTIPDLDVFIKLFADPITSTEMHRGISHSLIFSIAMAPILGWLVNKHQKYTLVTLTAIVFGLMALSAKTGFLQILVTIFLLLVLGLILAVNPKKNEANLRGWTWLFFGSLVTHPILDAHTTWGTQFFWPFDYRLAFKNIFVADPLYTVPFLIFLILAMCYKRGNPKRRKFNNIGLIVSTSYMALTFILKGIGFGKFEEALKNENVSYLEMDTRPTPLNTILWNAQVETETGYRSGYYSLFDSKKITFSPEFKKNHHLLEPYKEQQVVKQLKKIAAGWYLVEKAENDTLIFTDIRFGQFGFEEDSPFFWNYKLWLNEQGIMEAKQVARDMKNIDFGEVFNELGKRIAGN
ncbi:MAG: metal-dependent hydrolase [Flavobacteriales bacterium]